MSSLVSDIYVPSVGPRNAKIMLVGEAPGGNEEAEGEPFVGPAGQFLERYLNRVGFQRPQVFLTNLCKHRPKGNKFELLLNSPELNLGLAELDQEIKEVQPNLIVALGNWPMYYLTGQTATKGKPGTGIMSWRGSVVPGDGRFVSSAQDRKVLVTYHPAFIIRPTGFGHHPVFFNDLQRIKTEWESPLIRSHEYEEFIDPLNLVDLAHDMSKSEYLTVDIETFGTSLACVGFADSIRRGLCVTFENPTGWAIARELLASQQPKIFQFGTFDINYLWWWYQWETNGYIDKGFDTFIAAANLMPEFPRRLDFLSSMYTPMPFYKEERKVWKNTGDLKTLWQYNIKDVIATHWIAMEQMKELKELYKS